MRLIMLREMRVLDAGNPLTKKCLLVSLVLKTFGEKLMVLRR